MLNKEELEKIAKYIATMRKYHAESKCAKQIAQALSRCKRTNQDIYDAYILLGHLLEVKKNEGQ